MFTYELAASLDQFSDILRCCAGDYYIAEKYHQQYLAKGGRFGMPQSAEKGNTDTIRCYG